MSSLKTFTKVFFLLVLLAVATSSLPQKRICDPEPKKQTPTPCSNNENIIYLDTMQSKLKKRQIMLEERIDVMDRMNRMDLESVNGDIDTLEILVTNLSNALKDLEKVKIQTEAEFRDVKTQMDKDKGDIASLRREVHELIKHRETVGGNFSEIEKKLDTTERLLGEKKDMLENLELETKVAFNDTQKLLKLYKNELSQLNSSAYELELKVVTRLDATKTEFEAKLKNIQKNTEALSTQLSTEKTEADKFRNETDSNISLLDKQLKTQTDTANKQMNDLNNLRTNTTGIQERLSSVESQLHDQIKLAQKMNAIVAELNAKVAFSASLMESPGVFTGPAITKNILIFNHVFTNIGNAYDRHTGIFTAPLKGVYYFSFMTFGYNSHTSGAILVKNGHLQVSTWEFRGTDVSDTTSNSVVLSLNASETVNIILWKGGKVYSSVFSGFLIFQM